MIWIHLICRTFIILSLNTEQLLAQYIPLLGYTSSSPWELQDGFTEQLLRGVATPILDNHPCSFLATVEDLYPAEHSAACRCFLSTNCTWLTMNIWWFNTFLPQEPCGPSQPMKISFHFATLVHVLWTLDLVTTWQFFTGMHNKDLFLVEWCTKTVLSGDNLYDLTACYLLKQQPLSKSFLNALHIYFL